MLVTAQQVIITLAMMKRDASQIVGGILLVIQQSEELVAFATILGIARHASLHVNVGSEII